MSIESKLKGASLITLNRKILKKNIQHLAQNVRRLKT
ncbi:hypothetical protein Pint_21041 [Pistacia integerrima]|uniref:Uncharacterized protein n=1 Tax=Pistacia integerrima TaxID=434235 RepID=A0ACC0X9W6_9ROSI|nr:hypothetical protein Pint_21041 [Pistacia integerrima]